MITKRLIIGPMNRIDSAIERLTEIARDTSGRAIMEVINKDLREAKENLEYVMEIAE